MHKLYQEVEGSANHNKYCVPGYLLVTCPPNYQHGYPDSTRGSQMELQCTSNRSIDKIVSVATSRFIPSSMLKYLTKAYSDASITGICSLSSFTKLRGKNVP
ncbi:hypothetical protein IG631_19663 [Alternaria alternata]|nr:hypothetical protein IG631_19663 [Alternaria alternata]